ncbi:hypothetical protein [Telluribacter sp.]|jgi:hypothetical protein|uniref:hypothetical protein n=1 Tax=Telluribacter sp. TaxID=1978767 RepID=UPI002E0F7D79|nr:hypothetical protein [Telluribacter sp.]
MIAAAIGRTFLDAYNNRQMQQGGSIYDAAGFFEHVFFPHFYNHEKYMQWVLNSPFDQLSKQKKHSDQQYRFENLGKFKAALSNSKPHAGIAVGFPAGNKLDSKGERVVEFATTSSQVSTLDVPIDTETMYLSWIGGGLGIGVQGGLCIFFNEPDILLMLFDGWKLYRESYLNKISKLKGSQIETWNGQWIAHRLDEDFLPEEPLLDFAPIEKGGEKLETQSWVKVAVGLAMNFPNSQLLGYVYSYGQTNRSIGFIPFVLPQIKKPLTLYRRLFDTEAKLSQTKLEELFGTEYGFLKACEMGVIGLKAMEPKGIRAYLGFEGEAKLPKYSKNEDSQPLHFSIYITWIIAMLNNEELWTKAEEYAQALIKYEEGAGKAKKDRTNDVTSFLKVSFPRPLMDALTTIAEKAEERDSLLELGKAIHFLPKDNVPYFMTLIRFRYAFLKK